MIIIDLKLTCTEGSSNKYWIGQALQDIDADGKLKYLFRAHYGKIGTTGTSNVKPAANAHTAVRMLLTKIKEKLKKGYVCHHPPDVIDPAAIKDERHDIGLPHAVKWFQSNIATLPGWVKPEAKEVKASPPDEKENTSHFGPASEIKHLLEERKRTAKILI